MLQAFDTLSDKDKKRAYDSSANFDDSIPSKDLTPRKFYAAYGECFDRNLRFAVLEKVSKKSGGRRGSKPKMEKVRGQGAVRDS